MGQKSKRPAARLNERTGQQMQSFASACGDIPARCPTCRQMRMSTSVMDDTLNAPA